ncbi:hypothetical protein [Spiroplasma clarkii]|uniref:hypothetical protein n=1 Tax=Spiroplasma clarkii TaxID=2139 RepID=UPI0011BA8E2E|nr:hypothetical protein [Spiroplasma clarkii]
MIFIYSIVVTTILTINISRKRYEKMYYEDIMKWIEASVLINSSIIFIPSYMLNRKIVKNLDKNNAKQKPWYFLSHYHTKALDFVILNQLWLILLGLTILAIVIQSSLVVVNIVGYVILFLIFYIPFTVGLVVFLQKFKELTLMTEVKFNVLFTVLIFLIPIFGGVYLIVKVKQTANWLKFKAQQETPV